VDRFIAQVSVKWKQCLAKPDEFAINYEDELLNRNMDGKGVAGVLCQWTPSDSSKLFLLK